MKKGPKRFWKRFWFSDRRMHGDLQEQIISSVSRIVWSKINTAADIWQSRTC